MRALGYVAVALVCLAPIAAADEKKEPQKDVDVKVKIPKTMKVKDTNVAGGQTGEFTVEVEVKNNGKEAIVYSSANIDVKVTGKGLVPNMISMERLIDARQLQPGESVSGKRTVKLNTLVPEEGDKFQVEVTVYGHVTKGDVTATKKK